jgi:acyl-CoA thioesterase
VADAVFRRDGDHFVPTRHAAGPWSTEVLHGGPPSALLARAIERAQPDPELQVVRLTVDLFRAVPLAPLEVHAEPIRAGRRIVAMRSSLLADGVEVARAHALLLRRLAPPAAHGAIAPPPGPDGIETTPLQRRPGGVPPEIERMPGGFHTLVQARWVTSADAEAPASVWIRIPLPIVEGEEITPLQRAAATSDFGNALANFMPRDPSTSGPTSMINTDVTLYLLHPPAGEWLCLRVDSSLSDGGIGLVELSQFDERGRYGHSVQARLANARAGTRPSASTNG